MALLNKGRRLNSDVQIYGSTSSPEGGTTSTKLICNIYHTKMSLKSLIKYRVKIENELMEFKFLPGEKYKLKVMMNAFRCEKEKFELPRLDYKNRKFTK